MKGFRRFKNIALRAVLYLCTLTVCLGSAFWVMAASTQNVYAYDSDSFYKGRADTFDDIEYEKSSSSMSVTQSISYQGSKDHGAVMYVMTPGDTYKIKATTDSDYSSSKKDSRNFIISDSSSYKSRTSFSTYSFNMEHTITATKEKPYIILVGSTDNNGNHSFSITLAVQKDKAHVCTFENATCTEGGTCSACGATGTALGHDWKTVTDKKAECGTGVDEYEHCDRCGANQNYTYNYKAHDWESVTDKAAECGTGANTHEKCKNCTATRNYTYNYKAHSKQWRCYNNSGTLLSSDTSSATIMKYECTSCRVCDGTKYKVSAKKGAGIKTLKCNEGSAMALSGYDASVWVPEGGSVSFVAEPETGYSSSVTWTNCTNGKLTNVTGIKTVSVSASPISYSVSYSLNGGTNNSLNPLTYNVTKGFILSQPTKKYYDFKGWSGTGIDGVSKSVTVNVGSTGDRDYTANWELSVPEFTTHLTRLNKAEGYKEGSVVNIDVAAKDGTYQNIRWYKSVDDKTTWTELTDYRDKLSLGSISLEYQPNSIYSLTECRYSYKCELINDEKVTSEVFDADVYEAYPEFSSFETSVSAYEGTPTVFNVPVKFNKSVKWFISTDYNPNTDSGEWTDIKVFDSDSELGVNDTTYIFKCPELIGYKNPDNLSDTKIYEDAECTTQVTSSTYYIKCIAKNISKETESDIIRFDVNSKTFLYIDAQYNKETVNLGSSMDASDLTLQLHYSNGTTSLIKTRDLSSIFFDEALTENSIIFDSTGSREIPVWYVFEGQTFKAKTWPTVKVKDIEPPKVESVSYVWAEDGSPVVFPISDTEKKIKITVSATDNSNNILYYIGEKKDFEEEEFKASNTKEVSYVPDMTYYYAVKDTNGNLSGAEKISDGYVATNAVVIKAWDKTNPTFDYSITPNIEEWSKNKILIINATDDIALAEKPYSFDNGNTWQISNQYLLNNNASVSCKVKDRAGNETEATEVQARHIDNDVPFISKVESYTNYQDHSVHAICHATDLGDNGNASGIKAYGWDFNNSGALEEEEWSTENDFLIPEDRPRDTAGRLFAVKDNAGNIASYMAYFSSYAFIENPDWLKLKSTVMMAPEPEMWVNKSKGVLLSFTVNEPDTTYLENISSKYSWRELGSDCSIAKEVKTEDTSYKAEKNGTYEVEAFAVASNGTMGKITYDVLNIDDICPEISAKVNSRNGVIEYTVSDAESGLAKITIQGREYKDETEMVSWSLMADEHTTSPNSLESGVIPVSFNDTYTVRVYDAVGNVTAKNIAVSGVSLASGDTDSKGKLIQKMSVVSPNWTNKATGIKLSFDFEALSSGVKANIYNTYAWSKVTDGAATALAETATKEFTVNENGTYKVTIYQWNTDKSAKDAVIQELTYVVSVIDDESPVVTVTSTPANREISYNVNDAKSGLAKITIQGYEYRDEIDICSWSSIASVHSASGIDSATGTIPVLFNGLYSVRVYDTVGNVTTKKVNVSGSTISDDETTFNPEMSVVSPNWTNKATGIKLSFDFEALSSGVKANIYDTYFWSYISDGKPVSVETNNKYFVAHKNGIYTVFIYQWAADELNRGPVIQKINYNVTSVDEIAPVVSLKQDGNDIEIISQDTESGLAKIYIDDVSKDTGYNNIADYNSYADVNKASEKTESTVKYSVSLNGIYKVKVLDSVGNVTVSTVTVNGLSVPSDGIMEDGNKLGGIFNKNMTPNDVDTWVAPEVGIHLSLDINNISEPFKSHIGSCDWVRGENTESQYEVIARENGVYKADIKQKDGSTIAGVVFNVKNVDSTKPSVVLTPDTGNKRILISAEDAESGVARIYIRGGEYNEDTLVKEYNGISCVNTVKTKNIASDWVDVLFNTEYSITVIDSVGNSTIQKINMTGLPAVSPSEVSTSSSEKYSITVKVKGQGRAKACMDSSMPGNEVYLSYLEEDVFAGWVSDDVEISENTFIMPEKDVIITAVFGDEEETHLVTVKDSDGGIASVIFGNQYAKGSNVYLSYKANTGYKFKEWKSDEVSISDDTFVMPGCDVILTPVFEEEGKEYNVTVLADDNGNASSLFGNLFKEGETVYLSVSPVNGYTFDRWEVVKGNVLIVNDAFVMPGCDVEINGIFKEISGGNYYRVRATAETGGAAGVIGSDYLTEGSLARVINKANDGYKFTGWDCTTENCTVLGNNTFVMPDGDVSVKAMFGVDADYKEALSHTITIVNGENGKSAVVGSYSRMAGETVSLVSKADVGYEFDRWISVVSVENDTFIMPDEDVVITSSFKEKSDDELYAVSVTSTKNGVASVIGSITYKAGDTVILKARAYQGFVLSGWESEDVQVDENGMFVMPDKDVRVKALFVRNLAESLSVTDEDTGYTKSSVTLKVNVPVEARGQLSESPYSWDGGKTWAASNKYAVTENGIYTAYIKLKDGTIVKCDPSVVDRIDNTPPSINANVSYDRISISAYDEKAGLCDVLISGPEGAVYHTVWYKADENPNDDIPEEEVIEDGYRPDLGFMEDGRFSLIVQTDTLGEYVITCADRIGNEYSYTVHVNTIPSLMPDEIAKTIGADIQYENKDTVSYAKDKVYGVLVYPENLEKSFSEKPFCWLRKGVEATYDSAWKSENAYEITENGNYVYWLKLSNGTIVQGSSVMVSQIDKDAPLLTASVNDAKIIVIANDVKAGIDRIEMYGPDNKKIDLDNSIYATSSKAEFDYRLEYISSSSGIHTIKAYDKLGNMSETSVQVNSKVLRVVAPQPITGLVNGTPFTKDDLTLPDTVEIIVTGGRSLMAPVSWDLENLMYESKYNPASINEQTFYVKGQVGTVEHIDVDSTVSCVVSVTVNAMLENKHKFVLQYQDRETGESAGSLSGLNERLSRIKSDSVPANEADKTEGGYDINSEYVVIKMKKNRFTYSDGGVIPSFNITYLYKEYKDDGTEGPEKIMKLKVNRDYIVNIKDNDKSGVATLVLTGTGDFVGAINQDFTIEKKDMKSLKVSSPSNVLYTGEDLSDLIRESLLIYDKGNLVSTDEFVLNFPETPVGKAGENITYTFTVSAAENGNYTGSLKKPLKVTIIGADESLGDFAQATVELKENKVYTYNGGKPVKAKVKVVCQGRTLKAKDYNLVYENNINAGTATVYAVGKGEFYGHTEALEYIIEPKDLSKVRVSKIGRIPYRASISDIKLNVRDGRKKLACGSDYVATFEDISEWNLLGIKAKQSVIKLESVEGSNYVGTKSINVIVTPKSLTSRLTTKIVVMDGYIRYDGDAAQPEVAVYYNSLPLTLGKDYIVEYKNNTKAGKKGTATIKGIGNYTGIRKIKFKVELMPDGK